jgi:branched-chain amino acid transport system substrate-binding protein
LQSSSSHINPMPEMQAFVKKFEEKFHRACFSTSIDNYDGAMVIAEVLRRVGTDPNKIQKAFNTMTFQGIGEKIRFDAKGQGEKGVFIAKVEGNKFKFVEFLQP